MIIRIPLSVNGIADAKRKIQEYRRSIERKADELAHRVSDEIAAEAQNRFNTAVYDDLIRFGYRKPNVTVRVEADGVSHYLVIADGEEAIFVEFGAGVFHNGAAGSSPHPLGAENGFTIGSYGENGKRSAWGFIGEDGEVYLTRGTKAQMPLYLTVRSVVSQIPQIAREVFGSD